MARTEQDTPYAEEAETSLEAARTVERTTKDTDEARILAHIQRCGAAGCTCDEVEVAFGLSHQTASARINGLARDGKIIVDVFEDGDGNLRTVKRLTRRNCKAQVYVASCAAISKRSEVNR